jgi:hypothetical protein
LEKLRNRDLEPAIAWARQHRQELLARGSTLEFELFRVQFVALLVGEKTTKPCLDFAKEHFAAFTQTHPKGNAKSFCLFVRNPTPHVFCTFQV